MYIDRHATPLRIALILVHTSFSIHSIFYSLNSPTTMMMMTRIIVLSGKIKNLFSITLNCDTLNVVVEEGGKPQNTLKVIEVNSFKIMI